MLFADISQLRHCVQKLARAAGLAASLFIGLGTAATALSPATASAADGDGWFSAIDAGRGAKRSGPHVIVDIVAEKDALTPQAENRLAVRFTHEEGWHTYWKMPGDAGLPPEFTFTASPSSLKLTEPLFTLPERTVTSGLTTFGYGAETLFPFTATLPRGVSGNAEIRLHVEYLVCREMCVPESADVRKVIPINVTGNATSDARAISEALRSVPEKVAGSDQLSAVIDGSRLRIDVAGSATVAKSLDFLPLERNVIALSDAPVTAVGTVPESANSAESTQTVPSHSSLWLTAAEPFAASPAAELRGVLAADGGPAKGGWAVETVIPLEKGTVAPPPVPASSQALTSAQAPAPRTNSSMTAGTGAAILFAFLGGLILNLMPCVFPVLSLKLLDLIGGAHRSEKLIRHGLAFTGGVLLSMAVLSGALMAFRAAGHAVGWGFQLQSAWVITALMLLFCAIACNLLGLYEVTFGSGAADAKILRQAPRTGPAGSFFSGILAVIVASPCTAPFMGAGIGYALTQPALEAIFVFLSLGLGMAMPWLLLCIFPGWARRLPKPGPWMVTFKRIMAIPMALAVVWLGWVLTKQVDYRGTLIVLCGLVALAVFCWLLGRRQFGHSSSAALMAVLALLAAGSIVAAGSGAFDRSARSAADVGWGVWSADAVKAANAEGKTVFADFTAAWCITCQANKFAALDRAEVIDRMAELGYVRLLADWTSQDPAITAELARFGRTGVPLYVIYRPDGTTEVLPELLTPGIVLDALK